MTSHLGVLCGGIFEEWRRDSTWERVHEALRPKVRQAEVLMFSDSVLPNWPAKMSGHGDINVDTEGTGKTSGTQ